VGGPPEAHPSGLASRAARRAARTKSPGARRRRGGLKLAGEHRLLLRRRRPRDRRRQPHLPRSPGPPPAAPPAALACRSQAERASTASSASCRARLPVASRESLHRQQRLLPRSPSPALDAAGRTSCPYAPKPAQSPTAGDATPSYRNAHRATSRASCSRLPPTNANSESHDLSPFSPRPPARGGFPLDAPSMIGTHLPTLQAESPWAARARHTPADSQAQLPRAPLTKRR